MFFQSEFVGFVVYWISQKTRHKIFLASFFFFSILISEGKTQSFILFFIIILISGSKTCNFICLAFIDAYWIKSISCCIKMYRFILLQYTGIHFFLFEDVRVTILISPLGFNTRVSFTWLIIVDFLREMGKNQCALIQSVYVMDMF